MRINGFRFILLITIILYPCFIHAQAESNTELTEYTFNVYDGSRSRLIPLAVYTLPQSEKKQGIVIVNHGYDRNRGAAYKDYSYISRKVAANGYFVISIQHELPDDELLAMDGNLYETRMPNWARGVENIRFVINEIKKIRPDLDWENVNLIGHSNGGDMAMLFATKYPEYIRRSISLDHRRMPIPLTNVPKMYSLRGCDFDADAGVLPSVVDQKKYSIRIIKFDDIKHGDMDDKGSLSQLNRIFNYINEFLKD